MTAEYLMLSVGVEMEFHFQVQDLQCFEIEIHHSVKNVQERCLKPMLNAVEVVEIEISD